MFNGQKGTKMLNVPQNWSKATKTLEMEEERENQEKEGK